MPGIILFSFLITIFYDTAYFSSYAINKPSHPIFFLVINLISALLLIFYFYKKFKKYGFPNISTLKKFLSENFLIILLSLCFFIYRFKYLNYIQLWDGTEYLTALINSVENFDFTLSSYLKHFNWYGHPSMAYSTILSIGQFIDKGNEHYLNITNLLLATLGLVCFYKIIFLLSKRNKLISSLITLLLAINPLYSSFFIFLSTDYPLLIFLILTLYSLISQKNSLTVFFGILLVFSKELGVLLYASLIIPYLVKLNLKKFNPKLSFLYILPILFFLSYYIYKQGVLWSVEADGTIKWNNSGYNCFGINSNIILTRLKEIFILNFSWIYSTSFVIGTINLLIKKKIYIFKHPFPYFYWSVLSAFSSYLIYALIFIGPVVPRYIAVSIFFMTILFYLIISTNLNYKTQLWIITLCIALNLLQSNSTIDPVSKLVFGTYKFGKHSILKVGYSGNFGGSRITYNNEYMIVNQLFNKFNKAININENTNLIFGFYDWDNTFNGSYNQKNIYISKNNLQRTHKKEGSFQPHIYLMENTENDHLQTAYYVYTPWSEIYWGSDNNKEIDYLKKFYNIGPEKIIEIDGYSIKYYPLLLLD